MAKKKNITARGRKAYIAAASALACILIAGACALGVCTTSYRGEDVRIYLPEGVSKDGIRDTLATHLGETFASRTMMLWGFRGGSTVRAEGSYVVDKGTDALTMARRLLRGNQDAVKVTFNNVRTIQQLADKVSGRLAFGSDDFLAACDSILPTKGFSVEQYVAAFLPDTYEFYWNTPAARVVRSLSDTRDRFWTDGRRNKAKTLGLTPVQVSTIASIVEEETAKSDERPIVARLYLNRLEKGMPLQADPTVKFAVGDFTLRRITAKHLRTESPYNTYLRNGLPPGPIRMAERAAIDAVLDAPAHDYIYMCAKEDFSGYHNFATTLAGHQANARRYHAELDKRGIK